MDPENTFYIGDEMRDIEAAKGAGVKAVAVCWGFNCKEALQKYDPDFLIEDPEELLNI